MAPPDSSSIRRVAVLGAGTMGHGIAHVAALSGYEVTLFDISDELAAGGIQKIRRNLEKGIQKGKVTTEEKDRALAAIRPTLPPPPNLRPVRLPS